MADSIKLNRQGIKATTLGEGLRIAVPIMAENEAELREQWAYAARFHADLIEWRIDVIADLQDSERGQKQFAHMADIASRLRVEHRIPVLSTIRTGPEGGQWDPALDENFTYDQLVSECAQWSDLIDIELSAEHASRLIRHIHAAGALAVVSHHGLTNPPKSAVLTDLLEKMVNTGADILKIAWVSENEIDVLEVEAAGEWAYQNLRTPAVVIAMGEKGTGTRTGRQALRSAFTFAIGQKASAPGQLSITQVRDSVRGDSGC